MSNKEPTYDYTVLRVVKHKRVGEGREVVRKCRLTPKRIYLDCGEVYNRENGRRIMPLDNRAWSDYTFKVDLSTIKPAEQIAARL